MKSNTFALTALASIAHVMANGWNNMTESSSSSNGWTVLPSTVSYVPTFTHLPDNRTDYFPPTTHTTQTTETTLLPDDRQDVIPPTTETTESTKTTVAPDDRTETLPPVTTFTTHTSYTTYCPESTVLTITVCSENGECAPETHTVPESSTLTISKKCVFPVTYNELEIEKTVTGFFTHITTPTVVTIETCSGTECAPHEFTVSTPTTLSINEAVIPTIVRSAVSPDAAASSTLAAVSTYDGGAAKAATGFAGLAGLVGIALFL